MAIILACVEGRQVTGEGRGRVERLDICLVFGLGYLRAQDRCQWVASQRETISSMESRVASQIWQGERHNQLQQQDPASG